MWCTRKRMSIENRLYSPINIVHLWPYYVVYKQCDVQEKGELIHRLYSPINIVNSWPYYVVYKQCDVQGKGWA